MKFLLVVLVPAMAMIDIVSSFTASFQQRKLSRLPMIGGASMIKPAFSHKEGERNSKWMMEVKFTAVKRASSLPLPLPPKNKSLDDFFGLTENRNLLFSAQAIIDEVDSPSKKQMEIFQSEITRGRREASMTEVDGRAIKRVVQLTNPSMKFIGIKLSSVVTVGVLLIPGMDDSEAGSEQTSFPGFPEFEFVLLETRYEAEGPRPLVWLFNKLVKRGKVNADIPEDESTHPDNECETSPQKPRTRGFTRVRAEPTEDGEMIFYTFAQLETQMHIPKLLVKALPFSLNKMQVEGSNALQNAIEKDIEPAMERIREAYLNWISF